MGRLDVALLHCADLVHPTCPWSIHGKMSLRLSAEFYSQFQEEERLGLPTLQFMGKNPNDGLAGLAPVQQGFIQFVVVPLWSALNFAAGENSMDEVIQNLETNRKVWQQIGDGNLVPDEQPFKHPLMSGHGEAGD